jgi:hypothetical protein
MSNMMRARARMGEERYPEPGRGAKPERLAFERFVERSLHEAYADALKQEVPPRFVQLLDRLSVSQGEG